MNADDPAGVVSFDIERRGTDGEVTVQWRLSATAVDDFIPPLSGDITFSAVSIVINEALFPRKMFRFNITTEAIRKHF